MTESGLDDLRSQLQGTYRIERELGGGGMSRVYLAEELALGRRVVLKVLPPDLAHIVSAERFEREIRVAARLQHPHIVPLLAAGRAGDALYYTMPHVEGESLRARLDRQGELPVAEATRLFREIADALVYAHREGVVHRDIKPDNLLLSHRHAMVTDFGVARAVSEATSGATLTGTGMAVGTPAYMSPEQAAAGHVDHRADLYALGLVAYELLAGHPPFGATTPQAMIAAHMVQEPPPLVSARPSVPEELAAVVHRCLAKRAADRYEDAAALVTALDAIAPSAPTRTTTMSRRALVVRGTALGLLAAGVGGGIVAVSRGPRALPSYRRLTFRRGMIRTARFGPDFQTVLYGALWDGDECRVYTVRPESPESSPLDLPAAAPLAVSRSGDLALALGSHYRGIMPYGTLARVPIGGGAPRSLMEGVKYADWSPDGGQLAVIRRVGDADEIEFPAGTVIARPEREDGGFSFVRVSPAGDAVAAFELAQRDELFGHVVIVDRSGKRRASSARYFNVFGLAWRDDEVWFTAADELPLFRNALYAMGASGRARVVARMPGNTSLHDIAPDGRLLIARTDDRGGISVQAPGDAAARDLSWLDSSYMADLSRDGRQVLFYEHGVGGGPRGSTYLRGTDGSPAVRLSDGLARALSPDGRWALVQTPEATHFDVVPTGAGDASRLARAGLALMAARWLPNGRDVVALARAADGSLGLHVLDVWGRAARALTPAGHRVEPQRWAVSPDGSAVATSSGGTVTLFPIAGGEPRTLAGPASRAAVVGWIADGILLSGNPAAGGVVLRVDPVSGRESPWADIRPQDPAGVMNLDLGTLVTTPDGRGYGYGWHRAVSDLYVVDGLT